MEARWQQPQEPPRRGVREEGGRPSWWLRRLQHQRASCESAWDGVAACARKRHPQDLKRTLTRVVGGWVLAARGWSTQRWEETTSTRGLLGAKGVVQRCVQHQTSSGGGLYSALHPAHGAIHMYNFSLFIYPPHSLPRFSPFRLSTFHSGTNHYHPLTRPILTHPPGSRAPNMLTCHFKSDGVQWEMAPLGGENKVKRKVWCQACSGGQQRWIYDEMPPPGQ